MSQTSKTTGSAVGTPDALGTPSVEILAWLEAFASAIRKADFESGLKLFSRDVVAFGTVGVILRGLDDLAANQWQRIWNVTRGFHFHLEHMTCEMSADMAWIAVPWTSQGRTRDGRFYDRHGRATYVLRRCEGRWIAVHSHHSLNPVT